MPTKCNAAAADGQDRQHRPIAADGAGEPEQEEHRQRHQHQRPGDKGDGFAHRHAAGHGGGRKHQRGDRRIDQPRPVHDEAAVRSHPVLVQVEPALPADQVAYLHEAQQAVIVAFGQRGKAAPGVQAERQQRDRQRQCGVAAAVGKTGLSSGGAHGRGRKQGENPIGSFAP